MNFPTSQEIRTQYDALPEKLRRAIDEPRTVSLIDEICERYEVTDDDREIFTVFAGYVLLGVLPVRDFFGEVNDYLDATDATATEIVREINRDLFVSLHEEIVQAERAYDAGARNRIWNEKLSNSATNGQFEKMGEKTPSVSEPKPIAVLKNENSFPPKQSTSIAKNEPQQKEVPSPIKPLVLHESKQPTSVQQEVPSRGIMSPFKLFSRNRATKPETIPAQVHVPKERIVHYSEARTQLTPFDKDNDTIDLELFGGSDASNKN